MGNGGATQAIIGIGFQPTLLRIWRHTDNINTPDFGWKSSLDAVSSGTFYLTAGVLLGYHVDHIRSLDADGFTVGDGTGHQNIFNILNEVYTYVAFR